MRFRRQRDRSWDVVDSIALRFVLVEETWGTNAPGTSEPILDVLRMTLRDAVLIADHDRLERMRDSGMSVDREIAWCRGLANDAVANARRLVKEAV